MQSYECPGDGATKQLELNFLLCYDVLLPPPDGTPSDQILTAREIIEHPVGSYNFQSYWRGTCNSGYLTVIKLSFPLLHVANGVRVTHALRFSKDMAIAIRQNIH